MATALQDLYGTGSEQFDQIILPEDYQPSETEEFMCVEQRAYFLQKLKDWKESIVEESRATMAQLQIDSLQDVRSLHGRLNHGIVDLESSPTNDNSAAEWDQ